MTNYDRMVPILRPKWGAIAVLVAIGALAFWGVIS